MMTLRALLLTACGGGGGVARVAGAWLALALRVVVAQAFVAFQVRFMVMGGAAATAPTGLAALSHAVMASGPGMVVQALCPVLLAVGLFSRAAALAMLLQAVVLPPSDAPWAVLLLWVLLAGPGALSVDARLSPAARTSAIPGLGAVARAFVWLRRILAPGLLLLVRLATAATLADVGLGSFTGSAAGPAMAAVMHAVPQAVSLVLAALLMAGLLVRPVAVVLAVSGAFGVARMAGDVALAWLLLSGLLLVHGAGWLSLDRLLAAWARRLGAVAPAADLPHVVVVGGGFGGIAAVQGLRRAACRITLVDRRNHNLFQPLLYQVATAGLSPADIAVPIRHMVRDQANVRVLLGEVVGIDPVRRTVRLDHGELSYDTLILATGARHSYFGKDSWSHDAPGLKSVEDALVIRRRLLQAFEEAENATDVAVRAAWLTFLVVGGGPTGVELAGAIAELARFGMEDEFRLIDPRTARVVLVQSGPRLLPTFPESLSSEAERSLRALGVELWLDGKVEDVRPDGVTIGGQVVAARTVLWAAGVTASPAASWLGAAADRAGRLVVGADLSVPDHPEVFAIGDTAASSAWRGQPVPGLAPAAKQGGAYVAGVIRARLASRPAQGAFAYRHAGSLATIGRQAAVADFGWIRLRGSLAWWLWGTAHIAFLVGGRNRVVVMLQWLWAYLTFQRGTRLITGQM